MRELLGRSANLTGFADLCANAGLDAYRLAAETGLPGAALTQADLTIPAAAVGRVLELAASRTGMDDFGLRLAETRRLSNMGAVAIVAREQPTLRVALEVMAQYLWMQNEAIALKLEEAGDVAIASLELEGGVVWRQATELSCAVLTRNIRSLLGEAWRPQAVFFRHGPPADAQAHRRIFGVTPLFTQDLDGLVLARPDLDSRLPNFDAGMAAQAERLVGRLAARRARTVSEQVSELILLLLPTGTCGASRVARHLGVSRRTLDRRLRAESASFSDLVTSRRRELVASLLANPRRRMVDVADAAGFSSSSSFSHWVRREFGVNPRTLRQRDA